MGGFGLMHGLVFRADVSWIACEIRVINRVK